MFDTLLDEFEAVAAQSTEAMTSGFRKLPIDDNEDNNVAVAIAEQADGQVQLDSPDELLAADESERIVERLVPPPSADAVGSLLGGWYRAPTDSAGYLKAFVARGQNNLLKKKDVAPIDDLRGNECRS